MRVRISGWLWKRNPQLSCWRPLAAALGQFPAVPCSRGMVYTVERMSGRPWGNESCWLLGAWELLLTGFVLCSEVSFCLHWEPDGLGRFSLRAVWLPTGHHITLLLVFCNACCLYQVGPGKLREQLWGWAQRAAPLKQVSASNKGRLDSPGLIHMLSRFQAEPGWTHSASVWGGVLSVAQFIISVCCNGPWQQCSLWWGFLQGTSSLIF